jgi:hypothetical protein
MTEIDQELLNLLKDGDERIKPSTKLATTQNFTQNIENFDRTKGSTEEELEIEVEHNLRSVIDYGNNAIKDLADLAASSEHPRPYEALSNLIKTISDANLSLLSIKKKNKLPENRFGKVEGEPTMGETSNSNGQFVAISVADLLSEIEKKRPEPEYKVINGEKL